MAYIDTKYLFKCETCRYHISGGCNTYCDHREEYSPNLSKIPTADVVEVVRCKDCAHYQEIEGFVYNGKHAKHCVWHSALRYDNDYCSDGMRKKCGEQ